MNGRLCRQEASFPELEVDTDLSQLLSAGSLHLGQLLTRGRAREAGVRLHRNLSGCTVDSSVWWVGRGLCLESGLGLLMGSRLYPSVLWAKRLGNDQRVWKGHVLPPPASESQALRAHPSGMKNGYCPPLPTGPSGPRGITMTWKCWQIPEHPRNAWTTG